MSGFEQVCVESQHNYKNEIKHSYNVCKQYVTRFVTIYIIEVPHNHNWNTYMWITYFNLKWA